MWRIHSIQLTKAKPLCGWFVSSYKKRHTLRWKLFPKHSKALMKWNAWHIFKFVFILYFVLIFVFVTIKKLNLGYKSMLFSISWMKYRCFQMCICHRKEATFSQSQKPILPIGMWVLLLSTSTTSTTFSPADLNAEFYLWDKI